MADALTARDDDRLPWLEQFSESERKRARKPVSRSAIVGLLIAFFGVGLAVAFSLGYRVARPSADVPAPVMVERQPERTASVQVPLAAPAPAPAPRVEVAQPPVVEPPAVSVSRPRTEAPRPVIKKPRARAKAKAVRSYAKRQPILRPFDLTRRPPPPPAAPFVSQPPPSPTPRGRVVQLGAHSTQGQANAACQQLQVRGQSCLVIY